MPQKYKVLPGKKPIAAPQSKEGPGSIPAPGSVIELLYNGDYPGYPCARLNGHWLNDFEEQFLCKLFGVDNLRALFDKLGAKKLPGSAEHMAWIGTLSVTASQNTDYTTDSRITNKP